MDKNTFNTKDLEVTLLELAKCDSTNDLMMQFVRLNTAQEGFLIQAKNQTKGRGQRENTWESEKDKNLIFSMCLKPHFLKIDQVFYLTVIVSLSLIETLNKFSIDASIKWPNDIYIDDNKVCGVLIENILKGATLENSIVGVGLNVNQDAFNDLKPVSMKQVLGFDIEIGEVLQKFVKSLDKYYTLLQNSSKEQLMNLYHRYLYRKDELHLFNDGENFKGVIKGVNKVGLLEVEKLGVLKEYSLKEIKFL